LPKQYYQIALPVPLRRLFDYSGDEQLCVGARVRVQFASRRLVGVVMAVTQPDYDLAKIKQVDEVLDDQSLLDTKTLELCRWVASYYHHPIGEVVARAIPVALRKGESAALPFETRWTITELGESIDIETLNRAKQQQRAMQLFKVANSMRRAELAAMEIGLSVVRALVDKGWLAACDSEVGPVVAAQAKADYLPTAQQQQTIDAVDLDQYSVTLIDGVTGSGKTEVYIHLIQRVVAAGRQVLVLVPEIGLTPQLLNRISSRVAVPVVTYHSHNSEKHQLYNWLFACHQKAGVIVGTRSAVFAQLPKLGLIIVDEEHDGSFKANDSVRFNARDLAVKRANDAAVPLVMGSATPSMESMLQVNANRYQYTALKSRATGAQKPDIRLIDTKLEPCEQGLSAIAIDAVHQALARSEQVLIFLNRRGYSPELLCRSCGWQAQCHYCDTLATAHLARNQLGCHHCGSFWQLPSRCGSCNSINIDFQGVGTERLEYNLESLFSDYEVIRVDRDTVSTESKLATNLAKINSGEPCVIVGTQMLAKGHHFKNLKLVLVLGIDQALMAADFRAAERAGQLLTQVAGRAGREGTRGLVMVQTEMPDHPWVRCLAEEPYSSYLSLLSADRQQTQLPPFRYMAIVRCEAFSAAEGQGLLQSVRDHFSQFAQHQRVQLIGPLQAPIARISGRHRFQLWLMAQKRSELHQTVAPMVNYLEQHPVARNAKRIRWIIDIDPQDMS